ncbi:thioredoxin family protein [Desulfobulbus sp. AH-315-M07]|nr:thioredoxin family protein [Desulfobulbus sp. AH-315-M07]
MTKTIEIFTAGCPLCEQTEALVAQATCPSCTVIVYDLAKGCETGRCHDKAREYGVQALPAVVIDGQLAGCCKRAPDASTLTRLLSAA